MTEYQVNSVLDLTYVGEKNGREAGVAVGGDTGRRLARLLGVEFDDLIRRASRYNVWRHDEESRVVVGRRRVADLAPTLHRRVVVALGGRVADAFEIGHSPVLSVTFVQRSVGRFVVARLPHPSGRNRWYNDVENRRATRAFVDRVAREVRYWRLTRGALPREGLDAFHDALIPSERAKGRLADGDRRREVTDVR